jgi:hypothetical protein
LSQRDEALELKYSPSAKALIMLGVPMFAGLGVFALWFAVTYWARGAVLAGLFGIMGVWFLYASLVTSRLIRFLNVRVILHSDRIEVRHGRDVRSLTWSEVGRVRHDGLLHVLSVRDIRGQIFLMVGTQRTGFTGLDAVLTRRSA